MSDENDYVYDVNVWVLKLTTFMMKINEWWNWLYLWCRCMSVEIDYVYDEDKWVKELTLSMM